MTILPLRFWGRVLVVGSSCGEWQGHIDPQGYGHLKWDGANQYVHRIVYRALVGAIPAGFVIDHLCRNLRCVNPMHLEAVTNGENIRRGYAHKRAA